MRVAVCLDDKGGMMFNHRRQSRDRTVTEDVIASAGNSTLYLAPYSEKLFSEAGASFVADDRFLSMAEQGELCFVEDRHLLSVVDRIEEVIVYRWNRSYPTDLFFDLDLTALGFCLREATEWEGYSHEKITKEIFVK
jgi:hypothetical protein